MSWHSERNISRSEHSHVSLDVEAETSCGSEPSAGRMHKMRQLVALRVA